jgi:hypothetical protein
LFSQNKSFIKILSSVIPYFLLSCFWHKYVGLVYYGDEKVLLNQANLENGNTRVLNNYCDGSEFLETKGLKLMAITNNIPQRR